MLEDDPDRHSMTTKTKKSARGVADARTPGDGLSWFMLTVGRTFSLDIIVLKHAAVRHPEGNAN
ncbi:MAG TPA: hypothetical protein VES73_17500 [Lamprocystis sp. (in: g-proteobacteria)]|nr:hypothetical protein [Lamprocystis sp. (in: g-proteobacteria)]